MGSIEFYPSKKDVWVRRIKNYLNRNAAFQAAGLIFTKGTGALHYAKEILRINIVTINHEQVVRASCSSAYPFRMKDNQEE